MSAEEEEVAPWDLLADALGSLQELEPEDDPVLDVREGGLLDGEENPYSKIPLAQAENLQKLRRFVNNLKSGAITKDSFLDGIRPMARSLQNGLKLVKSDAIQRQLDGLCQEEFEVWEQAHALFKALDGGVQQMMRYKETDDIADVEQGLQSIEDSFIQLDQVQDEAIELGQELDDLDDEDWEDEEE